MWGLYWVNKSKLASASLGFSDTASSAANWCEGYQIKVRTFRPCQPFLWGRTLLRYFLISAHGYLLPHASKNCASWFRVKGPHCVWFLDIFRSGIFSQDKKSATFQKKKIETAFVTINLPSTVEPLSSLCICELKMKLFYEPNIIME